MSQEWQQELCSAVDGQTMQGSPLSDFIIYNFEAMIARQAGVMRSDTYDQYNAKMGAWLNRNIAKISCNAVNFNPRNGNLLRLAVARKSTPFIDNVTVMWKVNLNNVDPVDGRTVLDDIGQRRDTAMPNSATLRVMSQFYRQFRKAGALHAKELKP